MTSFKSQDDLVTAVPGEVYSYEGATLKASTPPTSTNSKEVATTEWVNNVLGIVPTPPVVVDAGGLNITYTSGVVINSITSTPIYITGITLPVAVGDNSIEYVWVRYLDEAVIASSTVPHNNQGYLLATVSTNGTSVVSITPNVNPVGWAPISNPSFAGTVTVPTPPLVDNSSRVPTTSWVRSVLQSTLVGTEFPTISITTTGNGIEWSSGIITIKGMEHEVLGGQYTFSSDSSGVVKVYAVLVAGTVMVVVTSVIPTGDSVLMGSVYVGEGTVSYVTLPPTTGFALIDSPTFTGKPRVPTPPASSNDDSVANTQWVVDALTTRVGVGFGGYITWS